MCHIKVGATSSTATEPRRCSARTTPSTFRNYQKPLATAFPGFAGGVRAASGDVNGDDDKPDLLVGRSGSDWTFDFQPQLTTEPFAPAGPGAPG